MHGMVITIYSKWADCPEFRIETDGREPTWTGSVEAESLEDVFRLFNRVTPEDGNRLEDMGYHLPSLSVGDVVTMHCGLSEHYFVSRVGFCHIDEDEYMTVRRTDRRSRMWRLIEDLFSKEAL